MNRNNLFHSNGNIVPSLHLSDISSEDSAIRSITVRRPTHLQELLPIEEKEEGVIDSAVASGALS
jgi:hypothetical protein